MRGLGVGARSATKCERRIRPRKTQSRTEREPWKGRSQTQEKSEREGEGAKAGRGRRERGPELRLRLRESGEGGEKDWEGQERDLARTWSEREIGDKMRKEDQTEESERESWKVL